MIISWEKLTFLLLNLMDVLLNLPVAFASRLLDWLRKILKLLYLESIRE